MNPDDMLARQSGERVMDKLCISMADLTKLRPCPDSSRRVRAALKKLDREPNHCFTAAEARAAGCTFDDIAWAASAVALKEKAVERRVRLYLADCAARVLPIFEERFPDDGRPRCAIHAVRTWARSPDSEAAWAARAAEAAEAAWAARAAGAAGAARAAERDWQFDRLVLWLSDPEPKPLRLPARPVKLEKE